MVTPRAVLFLFNVIETNFLRSSSTSEFSHSLGHEETWLPGENNFAAQSAAMRDFMHGSGSVEKDTTGRIAG
jgi:hypothetical protein